MNATAADIVRALQDLCTTAPHGQKLLREIRDLLSRELSGSGMMSVTLMTPSGNEPELVASVGAMLQKKYGQTAEITQRKNPALIGGAVLQIGDEQIDLSVRGAFNDLEIKMRVLPIA